MRTDLDRAQVIAAAMDAATSDLSNMTSDRIEALTGGHGMLNLSVYTVANVILEELAAGGRLDVKNANARRLPMESVLSKCIDVCKQGGCDAANAALISAAMMYMAGSSAQVGIPAGNRKLGALARLIAGNDRCGVSNIPTAKTNNKLSGFPAVAAIYQAMADGKLTEVDGLNVPAPAAGSAYYGHSALGEDFVFPQLAANGARIGTEAMMKAYRGAGMLPDPFTCALFGAAAILEIVHPDAEVSEEIGPYGKFNSAMLAGRSAAEAAGLPSTLHIRGTGEEYDTGHFIGDMGLILKDIGGPSVIGMMALNEIVSVFSEGLAGGSAGMTNSPLGHICGYAVVAMKAWLYFNGDREKVMEVVCADRTAKSINPEMAMCSINITARKAAELHRGPITDLLIECTEPARFHALYRRAAYAFDRIVAGADLPDVVSELEQERIHTCEENISRIFSKEFGEPVSARILTLRPGARRKQSKMAAKYIAFDGYFEVEIHRGDRVKVLKGVTNEIVPNAARGLLDDPDLEWALMIAGPLCGEQLLSGNHLLNIILPSAISAVLEQYSPEEAADKAISTAIISAGIPGCKAPAKNVAALAKRIMAMAK